MNTLRNKLTVIGLAGTVGLGMLAIAPSQVSAAPVAPSQNSVKEAAPSNVEDVQRRRWRRGYRRGYGPAIALGAFGAFAGAIAANRHYRHGYYHQPYGYYHQPYGYYRRPAPYYYHGW